MPILRCGNCQELCGVSDDFFWTNCAWCGGPNIAAIKLKYRSVNAQIHRGLASSGYLKSVACKLRVYDSIPLEELPAKKTADFGRCHKIDSILFISSDVITN